MDSSTSKDDFSTLEGLTFEKAFGELETIVAALESEKRSLDESLALYERGQSLAKYCSNLLDQAELKVQLLAGETLNNFSVEN